MVVKVVKDAIVGFVKVVISIILAVLVLSIGLWSFAQVTGLDAISLIGEDANVAAGVVVAGMLVAIAIILGPTIASVKIE